MSKLKGDIMHKKINWKYKTLLETIKVISYIIVLSPIAAIIFAGIYLLYLLIKFFFGG